MIPHALVHCVLHLLTCHLLLDCLHVTLAASLF
jgi:hypothetical protein